MPIAIAAERVTSDAHAETAWWRAALVGCLAGVLALVRTHGVALLLATLIVLAYRRRWRAGAFAALGAVVVLAPWQLWTAAQPLLAEPLRGRSIVRRVVAEGARAGGVSLFMHTIAVNLREVGALLADRFAIGDSAAIRDATAWLCAAAVVVGAWRLLRRAPVTAVFAAIYVAVLLAWPFTPWRFVFAIWPLVVIAIGEAVRPAFQPSASRTAARWASMVVLVIVGIGALREESRAYAPDVVRRATRQRRRSRRSSAGSRRRRSPMTSLPWKASSSSTCSPDAVHCRSHRSPRPSTCGCRRSLRMRRC